MLLPWRALFAHGLRTREPLTHTRGQGDFGGLSCTAPTRIDALAERMVPHGHQGAHRPHGAPLSPAPPRRSVGPAGCHDPGCAGRRPPRPRPAAGCRSPTPGGRQPASAKGRGAGRPASATWARLWASPAAVVANRPVAWATSRAWRGVPTTTGHPAAVRAAVTGTSWPPMASRTLRSGWRSRHRATRGVMPGSSCATRHPAAVGRRARSTGALATAIPTHMGPWGLTDSSRSARPGRMRALMALATGRAWVGRDVTTRALPRPPPTSGTSVDHVPVHTFVDALSFKSKDTRERAFAPWP
jgi:hypothetical protein